jgi:hypothetical protein
VSLKFIASGKESRVRPSETNGHAESLRGTDADVGIEFARRNQKSQAQKIRSDNHEAACGVSCFHKCPVVIHLPIRIWVLYKSPTKVLRPIDGLGQPNHYFDPERFRSRANNGDGLRMAIASNEKSVAIILFCHGETEGHRFGGCSRFIQQRRVCDLHPSEIDNQGLEIQ